MIDQGPDQDMASAIMNDELHRNVKICMYSVLCLKCRGEKEFNLEFDKQSLINIRFFNSSNKSFYFVTTEYVFFLLYL